MTLQPDNTLDEPFATITFNFSTVGILSKQKLELP
jgi:hypothetical protein